MVGRRHHVGCEMLTEILIDRVPSRSFSIARYQISEARGIEAGQSEDDTAVVRGIHVVNVGREKFKREGIREAIQESRFHRVHAYRLAAERTARSLATGHFSRNDVENL